MKRTNWSTHATFGGTPMVSRYTQQRVAASDHCVAIAKRCPVCFEVYMARPEQPEHGCQQSFVVETAPGLFIPEIDPVTRKATGRAKEFTRG